MFAELEAPTAKPPEPKIEVPVDPDSEFIPLEEVTAIDPQAVPKIGEIEDTVVFMYMIFKDWNRAAIQSGFSPSDSGIIRKAQKRLANHRQYFEDTVSKNIALGIQCTEFDPKFMQGAVATTIDQYTTFLHRERKLFGKCTTPNVPEGTLAPRRKIAEREAKTDSIILDVIEKAAKVLAIVDSMCKPQEKIATVDMV